MGWYRIKAVSHMTGIRPELLRMWERRYHLFRPLRAGNRYREYNDEDVELLIYLRQQIERGRTIGELASEGRAALLQHMAPATLAPPVGPANDAVDVLDELLGFIKRLNKERLETRLAELATFSPFTTLLHTVLTPLMHRLGTQCATGDLPEVCGHFAATLFKQRLLALLQCTAPGRDAPLLLCACPAGESHELGLLTLAYHMQQLGQQAGWRVYYLGANLSVDMLQQACQRLTPDFVALSLTDATSPHQCVATLLEIDHHIAAHYPTGVGGQALNACQPLFQPTYLHLIESLSEAQRLGDRFRTQQDGTAS